MRLAWTSDIHLNHVGLRAWDQWVHSIKESSVDAVLISGDISEADDVVFQLRRLAETLRRDIYFVLGNHDFYYSSIAATRRAVSEVARDIDSLCYLTDSSPIELATGHFLLGEDGWGDGTVGDFHNSPVRLNDFQSILDFQRVTPTRWLELIQQQGAESAERLRGKLKTLVGKAHRATVVTHVPPFRESCWYEGHTTDDNWAPFFVCGQVGRELLAFSEANPSIQMQVLCGHTHHAGLAKLRPNLVVHTAKAIYGAPAVEEIVETGDRADGTIGLAE